MRRARLGLGLTALLLLPLLGACQDSDEPEDDGTNGTSNGELTEPGTELALGDTARVPIGDRGVAEFTVTAIEKAEPADLAGAAGFKAATMDAYFIEYTTTVVSEKGEGIEPLDLITPIGSSNIERLPGSPLWDLDACHLDQGLLKDPGLGQRFTNCMPNYVTKGQTPNGVLFSPDGTDYYEIDGRPVIWRA